MLQVDTWRAARTGFPEVIWGPGKSPEQLVAIMTRLAETEALVVATRITPEVCLPVCKPRHFFTLYITTAFTALHIDKRRFDNLTAECWRAVMLLVPAVHVLLRTSSWYILQTAYILTMLQSDWCYLQAYAQVHQLLPGAHYSAKARILSLKTPGKRKQERLPGRFLVYHGWALCNLNGPQKRPCCI